ncbi:MAG: ATP-grasp domain-containing protein [Clostridiales bacterium]|nr:ATP-grasp domain-containing protein [Clostridiales bacterium]MCM1576982.1 ATP-grasp domain-containing protein [Bacteroides sp.]
MIWSVVSKNEMKSFGTTSVFRHYQEALGKNNIKLAVVDESDGLEFVNSGDIVLLRTASQSIINTINKKKLVSTAEDFNTYEFVRDKSELSKYLQVHGIKVPKQFSLNEVEDGKIYFVKPRFGSDSMGISELNICDSRDKIENVINTIQDTLAQECVIEEFIEGIDCTVACIVSFENIKSYAIDVECEEIGGIQTWGSKVETNECCSALRGNVELNAKDISDDVCKLLNIKHHARIDFRKSNDGSLYVIDVNLLPGLGPLDHFAKCMLLDKNISYVDAIKSIVNSAT